MKETPAAEQPKKKSKKRTRGHIRLWGDKYYIVYSVAGRKKEEVGGKTMEQAKRLLTQRLYEADRGFVRNSRPVKFRDFVPIWRRDHVDRLRQHRKSTRLRNPPALPRRSPAPMRGRRRQASRR